MTIVLTARRGAARRLARDLSRRRGRARPGLPTGGRGRRADASPRSSPRASRSTASTPASASSRACASTRPISPRCSATSCSRMPPASASRLPAADRAADDGAEARQPRAGRVGRALGDARPARRDACARRRCRSIPAQGSVGASGDLAPLAHMAAALIGVGEACVDGGDGCRRPRRWREPGLTPIALGAEGGAGAPQRHAVLDRLRAGRPVRGRARLPAPRSSPARSRPTPPRAPTRPSMRASTRCAAIAGRSTRPPRCAR